MSEAIIVIDVQREFFAVEPGPVDAGAVIERINLLAGRARARGVPVILVQHDHEIEGPPFNSVPWNLDERLQVDPRDFRVRKSTPDAFHRTNLEELLKSHGVGHVVLCGYATEFCIDTTTRRAVALGFGVTIARDAHTTEDKAHLKAVQIIEHHNATLANITSFPVGIDARPAASIWA